MKRFRYKGDLSKHIKRYHPGHTQPLTPVPLQEDELRSAFTAKHIYQTSSSSSSSGISSNSSTSSRSSTSSVSSAAAAASTTQAVVTTAAATVAPTIHIQHPQQVIAVAATAGSGGGAVVAAASSQQGDNKFFLPLLPQHPLRPTELVPQHKQSESKVILATSADGDGSFPEGEPWVHPS